MWVTDEALALLGARGSLRSLRLEGHSAVTAAGLEAGVRLGRQSTVTVREGRQGMLLSVHGPGFRMSRCPAVGLAAARRMRRRLPL